MEKNEKVAKCFLSYEIQDKKTDNNQLNPIIFRAIFSVLKAAVIPKTMQLEDSFVVLETAKLSETSYLLKTIEAIAGDEKKELSVKRDEIVVPFKNEINILILEQVFLKLLADPIKKSLNIQRHPYIDSWLGKTETNSFSLFVKELKEYAKNLAENSYLPALEKKEQVEFLEQAKKMNLFEGVILEIKQEVREKISLGQ